MIGVTVEKFPLTASKLPCTSSQRFSIWLELEINSKILRDKAMNNERFKKELIKQFDSAKSQGKPHVDINSGWLHRQVGGYPGTVCLYVAKWCIRRRNMEMKFRNHRQRAKVQAWQFVISYQDNRAWSRRKPSMELPFMKKYKISFLITIMLGWPRMKSPIWSISAADTRKKTVVRSRIFRSMVVQETIRICLNGMAIRYVAFDSGLYLYVSCLAWHSQMSFGVINLFHN